MTLALAVDQERTLGTIGASTAAAALGCDRYRSPLVLWKMLRGIPFDERRSADLEEAAESGQLAEPIVRGRYALKTNSTVLVPERSFVRDGWLSATPDGFAIRNVEGFPAGTQVWTGDEIQRSWLGAAVAAGRGGLFQAKTASAYKREEWEHGCPAEYEIQERVEMAVCDMPWADVYCWVGGQKWFGPVRIMRDAKLEDRILSDLSEFWRFVREGIEPTPDHTEAWLLHASERMSQLRQRQTIVADAETRKEIAAWRRARRAFDEAKEIKEELKNRLLLRMAAANATAIQIEPGSNDKVTAYQVGMKPRWKEYAISLGGQSRPPDQFRGKTNKWALRAPDQEDNEVHDEGDSES